jgi:hypothetical protein
MTDAISCLDWNDGTPSVARGISTTTQDSLPAGGPALALAGREL